MGPFKIETRGIIEWQDAVNKKAPGAVCEHQVEYGAARMVFDGGWLPNYPMTC